MKLGIIEQLQWRYATKAFNSEKFLTEEQLSTLLQAFNLTATSYGLQPIKLVVVQNKEKQKQLVAATMGQKQVEQASHVLVFCIQTSIDKEFVTEYFDRVHNIRNTPKTVLKPFKNFLIEDFENKSQDQIEVWATHQAYLAMGNLMTVCAMEGIDACPMEGFEANKYDELLGLTPKGLRSVLVMPIGFRADDDMFASFKKVRKNLEDSVVIW